jgi:hypothetical protein|tara:strand:+ start:2258 stop:2524 length:267 start_codon:yes stop_codon:yes gene_type:complete
LRDESKDEARTFLEDDDINDRFKLDLETMRSIEGDNVVTGGGAIKAHRRSVGETQVVTPLQPSLAADSGKKSKDRELQEAAKTPFTIN